MPSVKLNDIDIHYETTGNGEPLLLIAGFASDNASWAPVIEPLSQHFTLIMPDNRGCGRTKTNGAPITIDAMVDDIRALLDHLSIERAHVLGHSMGGAIAMALAAKHPEKIGKLTIASSSPEVPSRSNSIIETLVSMREAGASDDHWLLSFFHWLFAPAFFENERAVEAALVMAKAYPYAQSVSDMRLQSNAVKAFDAKPLPGQIETETLVLLGADDLLFPPEVAEVSFAGLKHRKTCILSGAAHSIHWDQPARFSSAVTDFLMGN
jgi:pimeloyl-ACP methyl ester carboxylesterase